MAQTIRKLRMVFVLGTTIGTVTANVAPFDWTTITPTPDLQYHPCYDGYKCARLEVPMDWSDPDNNATVAIAITTLPATVPEDDPSFGGTIVLSPGGPGLSGVDLVQDYGPRFRRIVDKDKHYELLGFDSRGIMHTTPTVDCFRDPLARDAYLLYQQGSGSLDASYDVVARQYAQYHAYGQMCKETNEDTGILAHVSTAAVARDLVEIIDKVDDLRHKDSNDTKEDRPIARLQTLAISYGSVLGNTFASMFPGRVGRMVLDAVDDPDDYMKGWWSTNMFDTEKVVTAFYDACFEAGDECALATAADESGADIRKRVDDFIGNLNKNPVAQTRGKQMFVITGYQVHLAFRQMIPTPGAAARAFAVFLAETMAGNYTGLLAQSDSNLDLSADCAATTEPRSDALDIKPAIACSDATDAVNHDIDYYVDYVAELRNQSPTLGPFWAATALGCAGWKVPAKWRFTGPFTTPPADPSLKNSSAPAAPLLLLSSILDPGTPIQGARKVEVAHPGSVLVVQDSIGHSALGYDWSECTNQIVREYFDSGKMPAKGTVCHTDCRPWHEEGCNPPSTLTK